MSENVDNFKLYFEIATKSFEVANSCSKSKSKISNGVVALQNQHQNRKFRKFSQPKSKIQSKSISFAHPCSAVRLGEMAHWSNSNHMLCKSQTWQLTIYTCVCVRIAKRAIIRKSQTLEHPALLYIFCLAWSYETHISKYVTFPQLV